MGTELEELADAAGRLAIAAKSRPELSERAGRLGERLRAGHFYIAVLGEFKRGKSTLVNALLGTDLLPTGVLPLTAVATEVSYGSPGATIVSLDGHHEEVELDRLSDYVTEAKNPSNERQVARAEVRVPAELLRPGAVLVDTPGTGSVFGHDEAAQRALLEADGAVVVFSADAPLSKQERELVNTLSARQGPTFFVLNRTDHLGPGELAEVTRFIEDALKQELGHKERIWRLSARAALTALLAGESPRESDAGEFSAFYAALAGFVEMDLVHARLETARAELSRLAEELESYVALESAAAAMDEARLAEAIDQLLLAAAEERQGFEDDRTLLQRDVEKLAAAIGDALASFAESAPARCDAQLADVARSAKLGQLEDDLRDTVEACVRESFEGFRQAEAARAEQAWRSLANRARQHTQERANAVRAAAAGIFQIDLPEVRIPEVAEEKERYFYIFVHVGSSTEGAERMARRLLPGAFQRQRLLGHARTELAAEFDKHAGRARWDMSQRLDAVRRRFEVAMADELERTVQMTLEAANRGEELRRAGEPERLARAQADEAARKVANEAIVLAAQSARTEARA
jgi:GTP-binding protein EngB required for normal cell division